MNCLTPIVKIRTLIVCQQAEMLLRADGVYRRLYFSESPVLPGGFPTARLRGGPRHG
jgi:hypothetical protein